MNVTVAYLKFRTHDVEELLQRFFALLVTDLNFSAICQHILNHFLVQLFHSTTFLQQKMQRLAIDNVYALS